MVNNMFERDTNNTLNYNIPTNMTTFSWTKTELNTNEEILAVMRAIENNTTLVSIKISKLSRGVNLATAIAMCIEKNCNLTYVNIKSNRINDEGATAIAQALQTNSTLTYLNLSNNIINNKGAIAIAQALQINSTLTYLNLNYNYYIANQGITAIADTLKKNKSITRIHLPSINSTTDDIAISQAIKLNTSIKSIKLHGGLANVEVQGIKHIIDSIGTSKSITSIKIKRMYINLNGATAIAKVLEKNPCITDISFVATDIGPREMQAIAKKLVTHKKIASINLKYNPIGDFGARALAKVLTTSNSIVNVNLMNTTQITHTGETTIAKALKKNYLLMYCNMGDNSTPFNILELCNRNANNFRENCYKVISDTILTSKQYKILFSQLSFHVDNSLCEKYFYLKNNDKKDLRKVEKKAKDQIAANFFYLTAICKNANPFYNGKIPTELTKSITEYCKLEDVVVKQKQTFEHRVSLIDNKLVQIANCFIHFPISAVLVSIPALLLAHVTGYSFSNITLSLAIIATFNESLLPRYITNIYDAIDSKVEDFNEYIRKYSYSIDR